MIGRSTVLFGRKASRKTTILLLLSVVFFFAWASESVSGQKRFSQRFVAGRSVRLKLMNRTGTITVEGWDRPEVYLQADREPPTALIVPQVMDGVIYVNLVKDNQGRTEVGNVNFVVRVPYYSEVDIETRIGNINVSSVSGGLVRAHISSEGSITLTNIGSSAVSAENVIGDIFYDGDIQPNGSYRFSSLKGFINIRIPFTAGLKLIATAPSTRQILLGPFAGASMNYFGDGRRVMGKIGDGSATLSVTNHNGSITFIRR